VWEHAYYLDYKNDRKSFVEAWFDRVLDWSFAERQLQAGRGGDGGYRYPAPTA
jgi:Fe-Mn family superoxide dismutase